MSNVVEFNTDEEIYEQASLWIARLDRELSEDEQRELQSWMNANPLHKEVLFEMASLWDRMDSLSRLSSLFPEPVQTVEKVEKEAPYRMAFAMAASVLVVVLSGVWGMTMLAPSSVSQWVAGWHSENIDSIYETGVGEHSTVNLPDGSQLILNTNSLVKVNYSRDSRLFFLERGEIHIEVAHDKSRPLSVIAADKVVQAVGTAFNVQLFEDREVELIVTDGKVLVADHQGVEALQETLEQAPLPMDSLAVSKGEKIVLGSEEEIINKVEEVEMKANLSWQQGNIVFRGETLEDALKEISRYTEVEFTIKDPSIKEIRIAGLFKAGDVKGLLVTLEQNFNIDHEMRDDDEVVLKSI